MPKPNDTSPTNELPPGVMLNQLITGSAATQMVFAAAKLGIADVLKDGPKSSSELAEATGTHPRALYRLLRALTTLGVFAEVESGVFALTPPAELLRSDVDESMRWWAIFAGEEWTTSVWSNILYSIRTNKSAFEDRHGMGLFEYCAKNPEAAESFNNAMSSFSGQEAAAVVATHDFAGVKRIVDVGGGHGLLLSAILSANPMMRGVLFDLPSVIAGAATVMDDGVAERCERVGGDFFESVPSGADTYIMKSVIHDWDDVRATNILQNIRDAIPEGGKLLLVERDVPESGEPSIGKIFDIMMLLWPEGLERTEGEYRSLLAGCGFELKRVLRTPSPLNIIQAEPV